MTPDRTDDDRVRDGAGSPWRRPSRRRILAAAGAVPLAGIAGCVRRRTGGDLYPAGAYARTLWYDDLAPDGAPAYVEPGAESAALPRDSVRFTLHNDADSPLRFNPYRNVIHRWEDGDWHAVPHGVIPEPAAELPPGETHVWTVTVDNTDFGWVPVLPETTETVRAQGLGGGRYAFSTSVHYPDPGSGPSTTSGTTPPEVGYGTAVALAAEFRIEGPALELTPSDRVAAVDPEGPTVRVLADDFVGASETVSYLLTRTEVTGDARSLVTEQAIRTWPLRDALAHFEPGVRSVRVETTLGSLSDSPPVGEHRPIEYEDESFVASVFTGSGG